MDAVLLNGIRSLDQVDLLRECPPNGIRDCIFTLR